MVRKEWFETLINALLECNATAETLGELMLISALAKTVNKSKLIVKDKKGKKHGRVCKER